MRKSGGRSEDQARDMRCGSVWQAACCAGGACCVPEHGGCGAGHGARGPLRAVVHVAGDTGSWANIRRYHLQHVELRRHLEHAAGERWVRVQLGNVSFDLTNADHELGGGLGGGEDGLLRKNDAGSAGFEAVEGKNM